MQTAAIRANFFHNINSSVSGIVCLMKWFQLPLYQFVRCLADLIRIWIWTKACMHVAVIIVAVFILDWKEHHSSHYISICAIAVIRYSAGIANWGSTRNCCSLNEEPVLSFSLCLVHFAIPVMLIVHMFPATWVVEDYTRLFSVLKQRGTL